MTATPYKPISWNARELISDDKMAQLANNSQWLFENTPRTNYNAYGVARATGVKIACGIQIFAASKVAYQTRPVYFNNFFSAAAHPVVTTGIIGFQRRIFCIINGLGVLHPDNRGFEITVEAESASVNKIERAFYVTWMAMGF
jgi:hypothetical protein